MIQHPAVFAAVRDAIFLADIDTGMIVDANPAAEALSGRTLAELQLLHHTQLHPPGVEKVAGSWFGKDSEAPALREGLVLHRDGRRIPVEISSSHFSTPDGRRMLVGVFRDLTERKLAEAKLKESEDRFHVSFFQAAVGIAQTAIDGRWLLLNDRFCEIFGYSREELEGKTFLEITYPDDREACLIAIRRLLAGETSSWSTEKRYIRNDGVIIWGKCFLSLVRDEHGGAQYFIAIVEEITQRIEAERALRQAEQRLMLAQSAAHLGVWYRKWGANIISISGEYARLHGFASDRTTVTREEWLSTIHPDDRERVDALRREARKRRHTFNAEYRVIWPDGSMHWILAKGAVLRDDSGRPIGTTGVNMDISERKQVEAALQESQERYKEVFDITSECIFLLDVTPDGRFKFAGFNPAEENAVGFLSTEVSGKFIEEVVDEQLANYVIKNYRRCLETGTIISYDEELVLPIGHRYFHTNLVPVRNAAGRIYRIVGIARDITGYRQTEEALRLSRQRLELAQEAAGIGSWDWDLVSDQRHCSKEYGRLYGLPASELAAPHEEWLQSIHLEDRARVQEELSRALEGVAPYDSEFRVVWPDGTVHWLFGKGNVIRDSDGRAIRMLGVNMEISERKYADQALRESEERFRNMADTAPVMIWVTGPDKLFTFVNRTWLNFTGRSMEQELGNGWAAGVHPDNQQRCYEAFCSAFDARRSFQLEYRLRRRDGEYRSILCSGIPRFSTGGIFEGYIGSNVDITDLQSEQRFRQLAENIDQVFWMLDIAREQILYVSPAFEKVWGCSSAILYRNRGWLLESIHEEDRNRFTAFLAKVKSDAAEESYRIVRPDGSVRWIQDRAFPIYDPEGRPYRVVGIAEDVTTHRELEEQLRQAHKMEAVGRLAGGIAHDFNNLLTIIGGYSRMLLDSSPVTGPTRERLEQVLNAANRASTLTRQLLAFSRRQVWQPKVVNLNRLLSNMEALLRPLIGEHITIETNFDSEASSVEVDPHQIEQVVMNLAANARDAMPHGGRLRIQTTMTNPSAIRTKSSPSGIAKWVRLRISDTGCGMDDRTLERAFEPFFTTKGLGKGTGLGLSTVYGIVRQNQGEIHVSSELGRGTVFDLYFPSVPECQAESELPVNDLPKAAATETILVAEDEPGVRELVKQTLEQLGYRVLDATDGYEALQLVEQHGSQIHLLLTDVIMPLMNGHELAMRLRSVRPGVKVLYMSGYADEVLAFHGIDRPEIAFIQKPFTASELAGRVDTLLSADRAKAP
jgi:two-component system, cell cycle sensor histidine kinase and response regulator CckA